MPRALPAIDRDLWGRTLSLLLIGFICYALPLSVFAALPASQGNQPVLRIQGSNTIGAKLGPELVKGLFEAQGLRDIRIEDGAQDNEQRIVARQADGRSVIVEVAAHGSSTGFASLQTGSTDPTGFDLVVNATPLGMNEGDPLPLDVSRLDPATFVGEVVMRTEMTAFLSAAAARGCKVQIGSDMLFEQIPAYLEFFGLPTTTAEVLAEPSTRNHALYVTESGVSLRAAPSPRTSVVTASMSATFAMIRHRCNWRRS